MPNLGNDNFGEHLDVSNIVVGIGGIDAQLTMDGETNIRFLRDHVYVVNVTGDHNVGGGAVLGGLRATIDRASVRLLTINDFVDN
jgi:hypothetical protein